MRRCTVEMQEYLNAILTFNNKGSFTICEPSEYIIKKLIPYTNEVIEKTADLERYEQVRKKGFSDDHLATEIGLFVLHINQITKGIKPE